MIPTPDMRHTGASDFQYVYGPMEDSFLLMDAIEADIMHVRKIRPRVCVEIGCGSGVVSTFVAKNILQAPAEWICTDINTKACDLTKRTFKQNDAGEVSVFCTDLIADVEALVLGRTDLLLFNPPYVPTPDEEVGSAGLAAAWAGGENGRAIIDRFLPKLPRILAPGGSAYMVFLCANNIGDITNIVQSMGLEVTKILERRFGEHLFAMRFSKP